MNCKVTKAGDSYSAGLVSSTRMLPPPDLQERARGEQLVGQSQLHFCPRRWSAENRFGLLLPSFGSCTRLRIFLHKTKMKKFELVQLSNCSLLPKFPWNPKSD